MLKKAARKRLKSQALFAVVAVAALMPSLASAGTIAPDLFAFVRSGLVTPGTHYAATVNGVDLVRVVVVGNGNAGVNMTHASMLNATATGTRVAKSVSMIKANEWGAVLQGIANTLPQGWTNSLTDMSKNDLFAPGSVGRGLYEAAIDMSASPVPNDLYGHGSHVASIAAGQNVVPGSIDTTGMAPNARVYDVKVLNDMGVGETTDLLAGMDWVLFHAKEYNIRVVFYDPRVIWAGNAVRRVSQTYFPATLSTAANTYVKYTVEKPVASQVILSAGVQVGNAINGKSSWLSRTGVFTPVKSWSQRLASGSGYTLKQGLTIAEGLTIGEGVTKGEP